MTEKNVEDEQLPETLQLNLQAVAEETMTAE